MNIFKAFQTSYFEANDACKLQFAPGWLVATSIFMYLNFACVLLTFFICIIGLM